MDYAFPSISAALPSGHAAHIELVTWQHLVFDRLQHKFPGRSDDSRDSHNLPREDDDESTDSAPIPPILPPEKSRRTALQAQRIVVKYIFT